MIISAYWFVSRLVGNRKESFQCLRSLPGARLGDALVAAICLALLIIWPRWVPKVPGHLVALTVGALAGLLLESSGLSVATLGERFSYTLDGVTHPGIPPFLPDFAWPWLLPGADGLILQDYNKGTLPEQVIRQLFGWAGEARCPVFVDPKFANLDAYHGASLVKPNLTETEHFAGRSLRDEDDIIAAGTELRQRLAAEVLLITRGPAGMNLFDAEGHHPIPTRAREVADVCGAGDTVLSSYALASVAGASPREAAELANFAAGTVVEEMGVVPVVPEKLEKLIQHHALA